MELELNVQLTLRCTDFIGKCKHVTHGNGCLLKSLKFGNDFTSLQGLNNANRYLSGSLIKSLIRVMEKIQFAVQRFTCLISLRRLICSVEAFAVMRLQECTFFDQGGAHKDCICILVCISLGTLLF